VSTMLPISTKQKKVKTVMCQQCYQYQQNKRKLKQWCVNNATNINKIKESLNSDVTTMLPISTKQKILQHKKMITTHDVGKQGSGLWHNVAGLSDLWHNVAGLSGLWHNVAGLSGLWHNVAGLSGLWHNVAGLSGLWHNVAGLRGLKGFQPSLLIIWSPAAIYNKTIKHLYRFTST
jgi:hypothetical protein